MVRVRVAVIVLGFVAASMTVVAGAEQSASTPTPSQATRPYGSVPVSASGVPQPTEPTAPEVPPDYKIGPEDILGVNVLTPGIDVKEDEKIKADVVVLPDGSVVLPLINNIRAGGLTIEQFRSAIGDAAKKFINGEPTVLIAVKQINSRVVYLNGEFNKKGPIKLGASMNMLQMLSVAGGLTEYANKKNGILVRQGETKPIKINFDDLLNGKNLEKYNLVLRPGDMINVPE